jgi:hypothetical protein
MAIIDRASNLLRETEAKFRSLVSEAATSGDYASVVQITAWARTLSELLNGSAPARSGNGVSVYHSPQKGSNGTKQRSRTSRTLQRDYPQFLRHDDELVRVAWSKRDKKEYRHRAPHDVLKALAKAMLDKGADGRVFSTDQLLPIRDAAGVEIPNYQAYVGISLLKQTGLIDQHGRQGYSIPHPIELKDTIEAVWKKLPES